VHLKVLRGDKEFSVALTTVPDTTDQSRE
jgi:hypothetical protein